MIKLNILAFTFMVSIRKREETLGELSLNQRIKEANERNLDCRSQFRI